MAALICDICGGKLIKGKGGIEVCDSCGTEHRKNPDRQKIHAIDGVIHVDGIQAIDNFFTLAENAYVAGNKREAENYCNKVIEIDAYSHTAWFLKGRAAGWQSTLGNIRFSEAISCFVKTLELVPEEDADSMKKEIVEEVEALALAIIRLRTKLFAEFPNANETVGFSKDLTIIINALADFEKKAQVEVYCIMKPIAEAINTAVVSTYSNVILPEYQGVENRPNNHQFNQYVERIRYCTMLIEQAIGLSNEDDDEDIRRYGNLIYLHEQAMEACSWVMEIGSLGKYYRKQFSLTNEAKKIRKDLIAECNQKIQEITNKKLQRESENRYKEYWGINLDRKIELEAEISSIMVQINALENEGNSVPGLQEKNELVTKVEQLKKEQSSLGILKGKEKKILQMQIDEYIKRFNIISPSINTAVQPIIDKINSLNRRKFEIENELTKPR